MSHGKRGAVKRPDQPPKKEYKAPRLLVYGGLTELTGAMPSAKGQADGSGPMAHKT